MSHQDKALVKSFIWVFAVLIAAAVIFYVVASFVTNGSDPEGPNERWQAKVEENIAPVGQVNVGAVPAAGSGAGAAAPAAARSGEQVYNTACMACHSTGVAGAPKVGDKAAWEARAQKGIDGLLSTAINGLNAMPPRGTCADCSDEELQAAIEHMLTQTGI